MLRLLAKDIKLSPCPARGDYLYNIAINFKAVAHVMAAKIIYFHSPSEILGLVILGASFFMPFWIPFVLLLYFDTIVIIFYPYIFCCEFYSGKRVTWGIEMTELPEGTKATFLFRYQQADIYQAKYAAGIDPNLLACVLDDYVSRNRPDPLQKWFVNRYLAPVENRRIFAFHA